MNNVDLLMSGQKGCCYNFSILRLCFLILFQPLSGCFFSAALTMTTKKKALSLPERNINIGKTGFFINDFLWWNRSEYSFSSGKCFKNFLHINWFAHGIRVHCILGHNWRFAIEAFTGLLGFRVTPHQCCKLKHLQPFACSRRWVAVCKLSFRGWKE